MVKISKVKISNRDFIFCMLVIVGLIFIFSRLNTVENFFTSLGGYTKYENSCCSYIHPAWKELLKYEKDGYYPLPPPHPSRWSTTDGRQVNFERLGNAQATHAAPNVTCVDCKLSQDT